MSCSRLRPRPGLDALRASMHEQLERTMHIDPSNSDVERTWLTAGGAVGHLIASPETFAMLSAIRDDATRGGVAALLMWAAGIWPLASEEVVP